MKTLVKLMKDEAGMWHVDRTIGVSHIFTTLSVIGAMLWWGHGIDLRLDRTEQSVVRLKADIEKREIAQAKLRDEFREDLRRIDHKLDRLLERVAEK